MPISNWASFGAAKKSSFGCRSTRSRRPSPALSRCRKQIIDDIYQIMGLSDIMRGATDPGETLGAQQLKTQYGSTRIRDKQYELARLARDLVCITCEIIAEKFDPVTIIEMSQTQLPTQDMQRKQVGQLHQQMMAAQQQVQQAAQSPQGQQLMQSQPEQAQQLMQQAQAEQKRMNDEICLDHERSRRSSRC